MVRWRRNLLTPRIMQACELASQIQPFRRRAASTAGKSTMPVVKDDGKRGKKPKSSAAASVVTVSPAKAKGAKGKGVPAKGKKEEEAKPLLRPKKIPDGPQKCARCNVDSNDEPWALYSVDSSEGKRKRLPVSDACQKCFHMAKALCPGVPWEDVMTKLKKSKAESDRFQKAEAIRDGTTEKNVKTSLPQASLAHMVRSTGTGLSSTSPSSRRS